MYNITSYMNDFRETARHLWNLYFSKDSIDGGFHFELQECYVPLQNELFVTLIICRCQNISRDAKIIPDGICKTCLCSYKIVPLKQPIIIYDKKYPDNDAYNFYSFDDNIDLRMICFFDWSMVGIRDYRYYYARIVNSDNKSFINRDALVEANDCEVYYLND